MSKRNAPKPETLRARAVVEYDALYAVATADERGYRYVPAGDVVALLAKRYGLARSYVRGIADPVVYRENGARNPLALAARPTVRGIRAAVAKRRREGGTLARLDSLAASTAAALGRPVSRTAVESYLDGAGVVREESYAGRGTRARATATRGDASRASSEGLAR